MPLILLLTTMEIRAFLRNWSTTFWTFLYPIILLTLIAMIFGSDGSYTLHIEVLDSSDNKVAMNYVDGLQDKFKAIPRMKLETIWITDSESLQQAPLRISFSDQFGLSDAESLVHISIAEKAEKDVSGFLALVSEHTERFNREITGTTPQYRLEYPQLKQEDGNYNAFLVTGITTLAIVSMAMFGFSVVLAMIRDLGALKMFQIFPISKGQFIVGFILSRGLLMTAFCILFFYISSLILNTGFRSDMKSIIGFIFLVILGIFSFLSIGMLLVSLVKKGSSAVSIINVVNILVIFLSDLFIPVSIMPYWVQKIAELSPIYLYVNAMRAVTRSEFQLDDILPAIIVLMVVGIVSFFLAMKKFEWRAA